MSQITSIPEFYADRSIFITGVTGFMGKIMVEKLLRSCPDVKCLYLLIRQKNGKDIQERLEEILESQLFEKVKPQNPDYKKKCIAIEGDIIKEGLGLEQSQVELLAKEVSVVFHLAATTNFDEDLKLAVEMNVFSVSSMIQLCKKLPNLISFVHISTAYANCDQPLIDEEIHEQPVSATQLLSACSWMDTEALNTITPKIIGALPNTYTYTKSVAEYLLKEEAGSLPLAILRPSILGATYQEPLRGWVDNIKGATGALVGLGKGVLRIIKGDTNATADMIPADLATNAIIAVGWYTAVHKPQGLKIYNCTTGQLNPITWGFVLRGAYKYVMKNPFENIVRIPNPRLTKSTIWHLMNMLFDQMLPAYVLDLYMWISGRRRMFVRIQEKLYKYMGCLEFFTCNSWKFSNENLLKLDAALSADDKKIFSLNPKCIHWPTYIEDYCLGARRYVLKEDLNSLPSARKALVRLQRINFIFQAIVFTVVWRLLVKRVTVARVLWNMVLGWAVRLLKKVSGFARSS